MVEYRWSGRALGCSLSDTLSPSSIIHYTLETSRFRLNQILVQSTFDVDVQKRHLERGAIIQI
jgi:hypothetical protein